MFLSDSGDDHYIACLKNDNSSPAPVPLLKQVITAHKVRIASLVIYYLNSASILSTLTAM